MTLSTTFFPPAYPLSRVGILLAQIAERPPSPPLERPAEAPAGAAPYCPLVSLAAPLPHPRRAHLEIMHFVGGWVVVPRGQFKAGELAVFVPEGARLPDYLLKRANLWDYSTGYGMLRGPERNRVTLKVTAGVLSHGVLLKALNDPDPHGAPTALLFGPGGDWVNAALFTEKQCCARFLGVQ